MLSRVVFDYFLLLCVCVCVICFGVLDNIMYDQFAYHIRRVCEEYDSDAKRYRDYIPEAAYDADRYVFLPTRRASRPRGLLV